MVQWHYLRVRWPFEGHEYASGDGMGVEGARRASRVRGSTGEGGRWVKAGILRGVVNKGHFVNAGCMVETMVNDLY